MSRFFLGCLLCTHVGILVVSAFYASSALADEPGAVKAIKRLGGKVEFTEVKGRLAYQTVHFDTRKWNDEQLAFLAVELANLNSLRELTLVGCSVDGRVLDSIASLRGLQKLDLSRTKLHDTGAARLKTIKSLRSLTAASCGITSLNFWTEDSEITELNVSFNEIGDAGFAFVTRLSKLERLYADCLPITDTSIERVIRLSKLKDLSMQHAEVSNAGLTKLAQLCCVEKLNLGGTNLTDEGLIALTRIKSLKEINVEATSVSRETVEQLQKQFGQKLRIRYLGDK